MNGPGLVCAVCSVPTIWGHRDAGLEAVEAIQRIQVPSISFEPLADLSATGTESEAA